MTASAPQTALAVCTEQPVQTGLAGQTAQTQHCARKEVPAMTALTTRPVRAALAVQTCLGQSTVHRETGSPPASSGRRRWNGRAESQQRKLPKILESSRRHDRLDSIRGALPHQKEKPAA